MIKKLMKYDIRNMTRILIYFYFISIIAAVITRLINIGDHIQFISIIGKVFEGITIAAIVNTIINTFTHIIIKGFIHNFYKDESYLTHTLPVTKKQLLISKYISSLIVILLSVFVSFISLFIVFYSKEFVEGLKAFVNLTVSGFNISAGLFITLIALVLFTQICSLISMSFTAVVKGNTYNNKRAIKGMVWFAVYYFGSTLVTVLLAVIVFAIGGNIGELTAAQMSQDSFLVIFVLAIIANIIYTAVHCLLTYKLFNRGVNVD